MKTSFRGYALAAALTAAVLMSAAAGITTYSRAASPADTAPRQDSQPAFSSKYLVKEYMGMVAVYTNGSDMPQMTDLPVSTLPSQDRLELAQGVPVPDDVSLAMLLEDYQG